MPFEPLRSSIATIVWRCPLPDSSQVAAARKLRTLSVELNTKCNVLDEAPEWEGNEAMGGRTQRAPSLSNTTFTVLKRIATSEKKE